MKSGAILHALLGAGKLACQLVVIIVPLVTLFEIVRFFPIFRRLGKSISYGAGIILRTTQEKTCHPRELFLLGLFLSTCHGVVEDTLIFVVVGGNGWVMFGARLIMAITITAILARLWIPRSA
jgi:hypothetical protein